MKPICYNLCILQGATLSQVLHWYSDAAVHKSITSITSGWPTIIIAPAHGLPSDRIPVWMSNTDSKSGIKNVCSMTAGEHIFATRIDDDTLALDINTTGKSATTQGVLNYFPPVVLTDYTALWIGKSSQTAEDDIFRHTDADGGVVITGAEGRIELRLEAAETEGFTFSTGLHQLELISPDDFVTRFLQGDINLSRELT